MTNLRLLLLLLLQAGYVSAQTDFTETKISFPSLDSLPVSAFQWEYTDKPRTWIVMCHQAEYSKGEYKRTAYKLAQKGMNCLAIDQRSGNKIGDYPNETHDAAVKAKKPTGYLDAEQDIVAALNYAYAKSGKPVILIGSSYSASLVLKIAAEHPEKVKAVFAFSPGEYFGDKLKLKPYLEKITVPVWMTSSRKEAAQTQKLFDAVKSSVKTQFIPEAEGIHGASALLNTTENNKEYWAAFMSFLANVWK